MLKKDVDKLSLELVRKSLALATIEDVGNDEQSEQDRRDYCAAIAAVFPRLEKDIKRFMHEQLIKTSMQSEIWEQTLVGRGVYGGMEILLEHWKKAAAEHQEHIKPKEEFDRSYPIGEI